MIRDGDSIPYFDRDIAKRSVLLTVNEIALGGGGPAHLHKIYGFVYEIALANASSRPESVLTAMRLAIKSV